MCRESLINFDKYTITEDGKIFSKYKNDYILGNNCKGYLKVALRCSDNKTRYYKFHRVIWYYFNGDIPEGMHINHIDENTKNNALSNLNLLTPGQNANWGTRNERMRKTITNHQNLSKPIGQINLETGEVINTFPSIKEASRQLGFDDASISCCCRGGYYRKGKWINTTQAYGFGWKFVNI